jgi:hypothetical protein
MVQSFNGRPGYPSDTNAAGHGYHKLSFWMADQDKGRQERRIFFAIKMDNKSGNRKMHDLPGSFS